MPRRESVTVLKRLTLPMTFPAEYIEDTVSGSLVPTVLPGFGNVGLPAPIDSHEQVLPAGKRIRQSEFSVKKQGQRLSIEN